MTPGKKIKELRLAKKLSQEEVAERIGVTKQAVYKYENEIVTNIPLEKVEQLAALFGVSPAEIMGWDEPSKTSVDDDDIKFALFGGEKDIPEEVWDEVKRFAQYAKERYGGKK